MINTHVHPNNVETAQTNWWFIFNEDKSIIIKPLQCSGYTSSPHTMVVADTLEQLEKYITDNGIIYSTED